LKVNSEGFSVNFGGIEGQTSEDGNIITTRQSLKPTLIELKPALADVPSFQRNYEIMTSLGLESMTVSGSTISKLDSAEDSISVSDGLFVIDDVLRLNFEYEAEGLNAMVQKLQAARNARNQPSSLDAYDALKLRKFRLTLEDNSIVEKGLNLASEMTGQSDKNIKRMLSGETVEAFGNFVKNGGTFTIEATPPEPFALAPLITGQGDDIDPASLGFSASQDSGAE